MENSKRLKYLGYTISFQEVPTETTLCINISGCPHKCEGCHSTYLWEYKGNYVLDDLDTIISDYKAYITCVCFMGGEQNIKELNIALNRVKTIYNLKTCVYSGYESTDMFELSLLDYLKVGRYDLRLGGLSCSTTNQKFFKIENRALKDITYVFQKEKK